MSFQEEARELLPFVQAAAEGREVQWRSKTSGSWEDKLNGRQWDTRRHEYRIAPERRYRPYTREEWERVGKLRSKNGDAVAIIRVTDTCIQTVDGHYSFDVVARYYTNLDGSLCGVPIEGESE